MVITSNGVNTEMAFILRYKLMPFMLVDLARVDEFLRPYRVKELLRRFKKKMQLAAIAR